MKFSYWAAILLFCNQLVSQNQFNCGVNSAYEWVFNNDTLAKPRMEKVLELAKTQAPISANNSMVYVIPVVFHVLHLGGSENISDSQIQDALMILNRDFRKLNPDTNSIVPSFKSIAADCSIQFSLATRDVNGDCTNGITRHFDSRTNWTINQSNYVYTWDPSKYLNIYVVNNMGGGIAGYTYFPGTVVSSMDAIVILHSYVGSIGTANSFSSRALTHEVGHWLSLEHVWGSNNNPGVNCGDDGVFDTPITQGNTYCDLTASYCGALENVQNYMDYSFCSKMFTNGQKNRMHNCLNSNASRSNLWTYLNHLATGIIQPSGNCVPKADFSTSTSVTCVGNSVTFFNQSYNAVPTNWIWSSNLSSNTSTTTNGTLIFNSPGFANVKLKVSNANGSDSLEKSSVIVMAGPNTGNPTLPESFETGLFPNALWQKSYPQIGTGFESNTMAAATGSACLWVNNFYDNPSSPVTVFSPGYNFQSAVTAQFSFKYAYSRKNNQDNDQFKVFISTNCGSSWSLLYAKSASLLSTTGSFITTPFLNPLPSQWHTETFSLSSYLGQSTVHFKFEFSPGGGNNFYLDDINIGLVTSVKSAQILKGLSLYPNPVTSSFYIENSARVLIKELVIYSVDMKEQLNLSVETNEEKVECKKLNSLASGVYFLKINSEEGCAILKFIKSN
jgi:PKD repeat protein